VVEQVFAAHGLVLFDVDEIANHGGSLRIYARHAADASKPVGARVAALRAREEAAGFGRLEHYFGFGERVKETKRQLLSFLIEAKRAGKRIAAYGAPAKGNTLLNTCGIGTDLVEYTVDKNPLKVGCYTPGAHLPIRPVEFLAEDRPDYALVLPWNIAAEIVSQESAYRERGGRFLVPIPEPQVL
jgi:hypothetical protein